MKTIIGIDPGSRVTGYGIITADRQRLHCVTYGVIKTPDDNFAERLATIYETLYDVLLEYRPTHAVIEQVFVKANVQAALKLGQARGVAIACLASHKLPIKEISAREVKQNVVGYGNAEKQQVAAMVKRLLNISQDTKISADATDALAMAVCG